MQTIGSCALTCGGAEFVSRGAMAGFQGNLLEQCPLSEVIRKPIPTGSFTTRDPKTDLQRTRRHHSRQPRNRAERRRRSSSGVQVLKLKADGTLQLAVSIGGLTAYQPSAYCS